MTVRLRILRMAIRILAIGACCCTQNQAPLNAQLVGAELHDPNSPNAPATFPVISKNGDLQLEVTGWEWEAPDSPSLTYRVSLRGKRPSSRLIENATMSYRGPWGTEVGPLLPPPSSDGKVQVFLETRPIDPENVFQLGSTQLPKAGAYKILRLPDKLREKGIVFAAVVGTKPFTFPEGSTLKASTSETPVHLEFDQAGWRISGALRTPQIILVKVRPKGQKADGICLLARNGKEEARVNYRIPASGPVGMICGTMPDHYRSAEFGDMQATVNWWSLPTLKAQQKCVLEAFCQEVQSFEFNVPPPPEPDPESIELLLREYKIAPNLFQRFIQTDCSNSKEDDLLRNVLHVVRLRHFRSQIRMYSPATSTLVVRLPRKEIEALERSLQKIRAF